MPWLQRANRHSRRKRLMSPNSSACFARRCSHSCQSWKEAESHGAKVSLMTHGRISSERCTNRSSEVALKMPCPGSIMVLASYGLTQPAYTDRSFLVSSENKNAAFLKFATRSEPFDEATFLELRTDLTPSKNSFRRALAGTHFLLATPKDGCRLEFHQQINYLA